MATVYLENWVTADFNKGLSLKGLQENYGIGFGRKFEVAALDWLYTLEGVKYKSSFSKLDQCKGDITEINSYYYKKADKRYSSDFKISELSISPKDLVKIAKKGNQKATKELLKGDDVFKVDFNPDKPKILNGYGGRDQFFMSAFAGDRAYGGPGDDYFEFKGCKDTIVDGGKGSDVFKRGSGETDSVKILNFEKGRDKFLGGSPDYEVQVINGDSVLNIGSDQYVFKAVKGLTYKEQSVTNLEGETETRWVLN